MAQTDTFDAVVGTGATLVVVGPGGTVTVPIYGIESIKFPKRTAKIDKYTPIKDGNERVLATSRPAGQIGATLTYYKDNQTAMDGLLGTNKSTFTLTNSDGYVITGTGVISEISVGQVDAEKRITSDFSFDMDAGWTAA